MPKSSIADLIVAWENVLATVKASASEVPNLQTYTAPLEATLAEAKDLTTRLETRKGVKQEETQQRKLLIQKGKDQTSRLRTLLKAHFGPKNERIVEFGSRPIRPRTGKVSKRKQKAAKPPATPAPQAEAPKQDEAPRNPTTP